MDDQGIEHTIYEGKFNPFNYTIGFESNLKDYLVTTPKYPLPKPASPELMDEFLKSLTFFHEATHLAQYISCSYGLRTLRFTLVCINYLWKRPAWNSPIVPYLMEHIDQIDHLEAMAFDRFGIFLDAAFQMKLLTNWNYAESETVLDRVNWISWSPHFAIYPPTSRQEADWTINFLKSIGANVRRLPIIKISIPPVSSSVVINVAALMEAYAILVECNHVFNALGLTRLNELLAFVPKQIGYLATLYHTIFSEVSSTQAFIPTLAACIDVALMYDTFILYNSPVLEKPQSGQAPDQYPGETFIKACEASKRIQPITSIDDCSRFYNDLCLEMGLPSPQWMADKAFEVASRIASQSDPNKTLMGRAIHLHAQALALRCQDASGFPFALLRDTPRNMLEEILVLARPCVTFYNLHTRKPDYLDPSNIHQIQMHDMLFQALMADRVECPLKKGEPFYCTYADEPDAICRWERSDGSSNECLFRMLNSKLKPIVVQ